MRYTHEIDLIQLLADDGGCGGSCGSGGGYCDGDCNG